MPRKRADDRKAEIVTAALRLADELGPDRLTTNAVARMIGLSQPAIFRHFPTKRALWRDIATEISIRLQSAWEEALGSSLTPEGRIAALVEVQLGLIQANPAIPAILFSRELQVENEALRQSFVHLMKTFQNILASELKRAKQAGTMRPQLDAEDGAVLLIALVQGLAMRWSLGARSFVLQQEGKRLLAAQMTLFASASTGEDSS